MKAENISGILSLLSNWYLRLQKEMIEPNKATRIACGTIDEKNMQVMMRFMYSEIALAGSVVVPSIRMFASL